MNLTLENLEICINAAKENKAKYFAVLVDIVNSEGPEIIVNEFNNFDSKLAYYKGAYNNDLTLKSFNGIKIIGFTYANSFSEIEEDLIY